MTGHDTAPSALPERAVRELAAATAALVTEHDVVGTITNLLAGCADSVQASAAGLIMAEDGLEFLAATDHRAQHLELYQVQIEDGPAKDCVTTGQPLTVIGLDAIAARWPKLREPFRTAGFSGVHAAPVNWQHTTLGALNLFFDEAGPVADVVLVAQAFADITALVIVHGGSLSAADLAARTKAALAERTVIEQAKGVIAYTENVSVDAAFDRLIELARQQQRPLTLVATDVVGHASRGGS
ncbi:GAF and ANTAR domain-containing protein [Kribbella albertanoniae]|uniref:ANTAR domain-containing protein n=1 Tax=Kribbella albertanoniae TaxID=1266829 RepID=A0A4R4QAF3_9ACTN|nr:ANTAR domain-containing protein [Kribbella albertanoniae]TDC32287.1 ANTAR domain-containing protein [Kribbella albertanoniae]